MFAKPCWRGFCNETVNWSTLIPLFVLNLPQWIQFLSWPSGNTLLKQHSQKHTSPFSTAIKTFSFVTPNKLFAIPTMRTFQVSKKLWNSFHWGIICLSSIHDLLLLIFTKFHGFVRDQWYRLFKFSKNPTLCFCLQRLSKERSFRKSPSYLILFDFKRKRCLIIKVVALYIIWAYYLDLPGSALSLFLFNAKFEVFHVWHFVRSEERYHSALVCSTNSLRFLSNSIYTFRNCE